MGVLGTGVAAGVAQVGLQAQQTGRKQTRRAVDRAYVLQRQKEVRETRLKGLEEDDRASAETDLHVDGQLSDPDRHPDTPRERDERADADDTAAALQGVSDESMTYGPPLRPQPTTPPARRHRLDVEA